MEKFLASILTWPASLDSPPKLRYLKFGLHGQTKRESYRLHELWCLHLYRYVGEAVIAGVELPVRPGFASVTPPDTDLEHIWHHSGSSHIWAHFVLPESGENPVSLPAMQDLGDSSDALFLDLSHAVGVFSTQPGHAEAILWNILWRLSEARSETSRLPEVHSAVLAALQIIESRLAEPLSVAAIAQECGLSHNHLTRCFSQSTGMTVVSYIGRQRVERARHLLIHSTLPVKSVAAQVGLPDLHLFNKTIRRATGFSPRQLREARPPN